MSFVLTDSLSSIEEILEEARQGRMFILVDDEDRENEGDLIIPAQFSTPETINFMVTHGRGLVCLALTAERCRALNLSMMSGFNRSRLGTAFTVSIEAREGVTTGISAADRSRTVSVAIDPEKGRDDLVSPGHIFPLMARDGGVLARAGHTEAAVDIARLAGLNPAGVICEIMNDDGSMARLPDLMVFARKHGLKISTVANLIAWRRRTEKFLHRSQEALLRSEWGGEWNVVVYANAVDRSEHIVLSKGLLESSEPALVWMHALDLFEDALGDVRRGRAGHLRTAMNLISQEGRGVIVLLRESKPMVLKDLPGNRSGEETPCKGMIDYGFGAQILLDLGVRDMILLSDSDEHSVGFGGYDLRVCSRRSINDT